MSGSGRGNDDAEIVAERIRAAGQRALAEAKARRAAADAVRQLSTEQGGREGPDPVRYGDWEVKGIASDF